MFYEALRPECYEVVKVLIVLMHHFFFAVSRGQIASRVGDHVQLCGCSVQQERDSRY